MTKKGRAAVKHLGQAVSKPEIRFQQRISADFGLLKACGLDRYITHQACELTRYITHQICGLGRYITHHCFVTSPTSHFEKLIEYSKLRTLSTALTRARVS